MAQERFIETGKGTFYGEYVYDQVVPKEHFFRKLNEMLNWRKYTQKMMRWYKGGGEYGRNQDNQFIAGCQCINC